MGDIKEGKILFLHTMDEGLFFAKRFGYPIRLRSSYSLKKKGKGTANNIEELKKILKKCLDLSPIREVSAERIEKK